MDHKTYVLETRRHFSNIIRSVLGDEPRSITISDQFQIETILTEISAKINLDVDKMSYIWWWRGGNNYLNKYEMSDEYFYLNDWKLKIKELYINISPISIFDCIIFRVKGEDNDIPNTENYAWNKNEWSELDLNKHTLFDFRIRKQLNDHIEYFSQPYNFILTAQFGLPNLNIKSDTDIEIMLNKLLFEEISYEDFKDWYVKILVDLKQEIEAFYNHIVEFPMLALEHKLGKRLHDNIKNLDKYELSDKVFYRARALKKYVPYDEAGMWNPPADKVAVYEGRYNHFGQSFLYMATDEDTAFKEVIPEWHGSCSMIKIKLQDSVKLLDLRKVNFYKESNSLEYIILHYMLVHEGTISQETQNPYIKPEYVLPRFLADCARLYNFEGILFNSTKNNGINLVLFEPELLKDTGKILTNEAPYIYNKTHI
ncbi:RES family NAD+ phosphorylase [Bacillus pumilus]|uniref:RES family NAD+ phosphorylase n=1 Tax=Bacillus pumilus TaxID=1408 RepID=UPI001C23D454|nr:RES family NAD+ phosphorylase [Bacillus pumilus]MBU8726918.1 RES family NAD+ phosphorylase [Bacillus pumilus]